VTELFVFVEGQTEEQFVNRTLAPHLTAKGVYAKARILPTKRDRSTGQILARGGGYFKTWKKELAIHLRSDSRPDLRFTTLFDLYGLPDDFPQLEELFRISDTSTRADAAEKVFAEQFGDSRFCPYFQRHEFEAFLFADLAELRRILDDAKDLAGIDELAQKVAGVSPEDIDDGPTTAPSKRLAGAIRSYNKVLHGPLAVESMGLSKVRSRCPRFSAWVASLESLGRRA
jgi:hypothetical protein